MKRAILTILCSIFAAIGSAQAGTTGNFSGFVRDEFGKPIANATVKVLSASDWRVAHTDANGFYTIMALSVDTYTLAIEKNGYNPQSIPGLLVSSDASNRVSTKLRIACHCHGFYTYRRGSSLVSSERTWDSYIVPRFIIDSQIP
jgi:hypothetical protein